LIRAAALSSSRPASVADRPELPLHAFIIADKQGNPVKDLTVDDFEVYEDGKLQPIHTFALESYKATQITDKTGKTISPDGTPVQEEPNFNQPRLVSLVIDDITVSGQDLYARTIEALRKFVAEDIGPGDQVAILSGSGRVQYPFTSDKAQLLEEVNGLHLKLDRGQVLRQLDLGWRCLTAGEDTRFG
jgi:VWFA-related protein